MHAAQISFFIDPEGRLPRRLLEDWWSLVDVAEAAASAEARVSVLQASTTSEYVERNGVEYHFMAPALGTKPIARSENFSRMIRQLRADVFHVHGLGFPAEVWSLTQIAPGVPILLQDHANRVPRLWRRSAWRRGLSAASGIAFCSRAQSQAFVDSGLVSPHTTIYEIPESTSRFSPGEQDEARRRTRLAGNPAVLWVGHLDSNKDPLTVLDGVSRAARDLPELQLWCCFATAPLLADVQRRIESDAMLRDRVHLIGKVPHARIEELMRAADLFVAGSHREGSGYSLIEALACGLPPVVTDIPSFRALIGPDRIGRLWTPGDALGLCEALRSIAAQCGPELRRRVRKHFDEQLSMRALGQKLLSAYQDLIAHQKPMELART
jgi:glycosyltransferase involved in cell wall biosynthesis